MENLHLVYFTDPMCSWCYGFGATLKELASKHSDSIRMAIIAGGLRPDETKPTPASLANEISHHWHSVHDASGRPFDFDFFEKHPDFVYDTSPACKAVVTAWKLNKERTLNYLDALQSAFYAEGKDPKELETILHAAREAEIEEGFEETYRAPETEQLLRHNYAFARQLGVSAYPTLCAENGEQLVLLTQGYLPYEELERRLEVASEKIHS